MEPYKGYLIEQYSVQQPMQTSYGEFDIPNTVLTATWKTRIIDPSTGKTMAARDPKEAKSWIDQWALFGDPAYIENRHKEIQERQDALMILDKETGIKVNELLETLNRASNEWFEFRKNVPPRFE